MDYCCEGPDTIERDLEFEKPNHNCEEWTRWDDELVEDFGRWLNRLAKSLILVIAVMSAVIVIRLL